MSLTNEGDSAPQDAARPYLAAGIVGVLIISVLAGAAVVVTEPGTNHLGYVAVPVSLYGQGAEEISGLRFDIVYDPAQFALVDVIPGDAALDAGKQTILADLADGTGRVLIMGINQNAIADGVVATVYLQPLTPAAREGAPTLAALAASDPFGYAVDLEYENLAPPIPKDEAGTDAGKPPPSKAEAGTPPATAAASTETAPVVAGTAPAIAGRTGAGVSAPDTLQTNLTARGAVARSPRPAVRDKFFRAPRAGRHGGYSSEYRRRVASAGTGTTRPRSADNAEPSVSTAAGSAVRTVLAMGPAAASSSPATDVRLGGNSGATPADGEANNFVFCCGALALLVALFAVGWLARRRGWLERVLP